MSTPLVDCHTHTSFSDGTSTFEQNVAAAARTGVRVLACTDHLTLSASMEAVADAQVPHARLTEHRAAFERARALGPKGTGSFGSPPGPNEPVPFGTHCRGAFARSGGSQRAETPRQRW